MAKKYSKKTLHTYWEVEALDRSHKLVTRGNNCTELMKEIDEANARAIERGYKPEKWMITATDVFTLYDLNGEFCSEESTTRKVLVYPEEV